MKKSIVIIFIILFGFNGLCFGEITDFLLGERKINILDWYLLKVEMDIREVVLITNMENERNDEWIKPQFKFMRYDVETTKKIWISYIIENINQFFRMNTIQKEVELSRLVDFSVQSSKVYLPTLEKDDFVIYFLTEEHITIGRFENGELIIK